MTQGDAVHNLDQLTEEFRVNGFVVLEDLVAREKIDRVLEAWVPIRDEDIRRQGPNPVRGTRRYNVRVPFQEPFVDPEILDHPTLVQIIERLLGPDCYWSHFDSNVPLPGTDFQQWHRDAVHALFPGVVTPPYHLTVKFPLVDTCEENGSTEIIPGTHHIVDEIFDTDLDTVFGHGPDRVGRYHPVRLNLAKGSVWIQDPRAYHRGTPNRSNQPRDELCMAFCKPWLFNNWLHHDTEKHFPRDLWKNLSDHGRHMLRMQRVKDA